MPPIHCTRPVLVALWLAAPLAVAAQPPPVPPPAAGASAFTIFLRGAPIGSEQIAVTRVAEGWTILSSGRLGPPLDVVARRVQLRYDPDWKPLELTVDATVRGQPQTVHTVVEGTTARSEINVAGQAATKSDTIEPDAVLVPSPFFAPFEALAARLKTAQPGSTIQAYVVPQFSIGIRVGESSTEHIQTASRLIDARRSKVTLMTPNVPLDAEIWGDETGRLLRVSIPGQNLDAAREDIASVASRQITISRPNDEQVKILSNGFTIAGTLSRPKEAPARPLPAVVLTGGSGPVDRDELIFGIPILGQLAGALADEGFIVLRYDKRGVGQSGGRPESATLTDFSDDQRAAVRYLADRKDVDSKRIAVVGHSEGGIVSLMSAAKEKRIGAVGLLATNGVKGSDLILEQQKHLLDKSTMTEGEKQAKIELQKQINDAVITGKGLDKLPADVRRQIENAEFQSILSSDPAKLMQDVRQPVLIVQGTVDKQVDPSNADRLETLARARKNAPPVDVVRVPGVNHLLVPAQTGEVDEYGSLKDKHVSPAVTSAVVNWLKKLFVPPR